MKHDLDWVYLYDCRSCPTLLAAQLARSAVDEAMKRLQEATPNRVNSVNCDGIQNNDDPSSDSPKESSEQCEENGDSNTFLNV